MRRLAMIPATLGLCVLMLGGSAVARADTLGSTNATWYGVTGGLDPIVFSNFGLSHSYDISDGNPLGIDPFVTGANDAQGETFRPSVTVTLTTIEIALSDTATSPDPITVALRTDSGDSPGAILESFTVPAGGGGPFGVNNAPVTLTSTLHPLLTVGTQYWLTAATGPSDAYAWNWNNTGANADHAYSFNGGTTWFIGTNGAFTPGAFEIDGNTVVNNTVPEPASLFLLGTGLIGVCRWRNRRKS